MCGDDLHGAAAARAGEYGTRLEVRGGRGQVDLEQELHQLDQPLAVGVQKAEVARPPEASRQDVAQHQPQEVGTRQGARLHAPRLAVLIAKGDLPVSARENVLLPDHTPVQVAAQVHQRFGSGADGLAVHDPSLGMMSGQHQTRLRERRQQLGPKDLGQGLAGEQPGRLAAGLLGAPQPPRVIDRRRRRECVCSTWV